MSNQQIAELHKRFTEEKLSLHQTIPTKKIDKYLSYINDLYTLNPQDPINTVGHVIRSYLDNIYTRRLTILLSVNCPTVIFEKDIKNLHKIRSLKPFPNWNIYHNLHVINWSEKTGRRGKPYLALNVHNNIIYLFYKFDYFLRDNNSMPVKY
jgi:hypothetical protein